MYSVHSVQRSIAGAAAGILLLLLCAAPAAAVTITESPDIVSPGDRITIAITGLADGAEFSLQIDGEYEVTPGDFFSFETNNFNMPFTLNNGKISATTQNTRSSGVYIEKEDVTISYAKPSDANGFFSFTEDRTIASGIYDTLKLSGRARSDATTVISSMNLVGIKQGQQNSNIYFTVGGIKNGEIYLTILVDKSQVLFKKVTVGKGITATVTTTTTTAATTTTTTTTTATTTTGSVQPVVTTTATTTAATTAATTQADQVRTFWSSDRRVSLTAEGIDYAALMMVRDTVFPENWLAMTDAYTIAPDSLAFDSPATITFKVPASAGDYAYFIGMKKNDRWLAVPCTAGSGTVSAEVTAPAVYALMAYKPESTVAPATAGTPSGTAAETPAFTQGTPRIASIVQAAVSTAAPAAAATKAAADLLPVLLGIGGACAVLVAGRR